MVDKLYRFRISYFAYINKSKTATKAYKLISAKDLLDANLKAKVDPKLIYKIERI
tara:strand:+ start:2280 stop:2444 length:165 start_codon:yes stop_codon:yes gene_type:complete